MGASGAGSVAGDARATRSPGTEGATLQSRASQQTGSPSRWNQQRPLSPTGQHPPSRRRLSHPGSRGQKRSLGSGMTPGTIHEDLAASAESLNRRRTVSGHGMLASRSASPAVPQDGSLADSWGRREIADGDLSSPSVRSERRASSTSFSLEHSSARQAPARCCLLFADLYETDDRRWDETAASGIPRDDGVLFSGQTSVPPGSEWMCSLPGCFGGFLYVRD